ncbi:MAG: ATP-binding protein [Deltaproteobacteria bacterium]|nr:ATP-binding protein [Deltaproteobacteria bacterium]
MRRGGGHGPPEGAGDEATLRERSRGLSVIVEVGHQVCATLDLEQVTQTAVDGITSLVGLDTSAIYLLEGEQLHLMATTPPLPPDFPEHLRIARRQDHPTIEQAVWSRSPLLVQDFQATASTPAERAAAEQRDLRTLVVIPMIADDEVVGVFMAGSVGEPTRVSALMVDLSRSLANITALAARNARHYEEREAQAAELKRLLEERDQAKERLQQAQKMESVGRLAGGVAHDFNNMLSVIMGTADLALLRGQEEGMSPELEADLNQLIETAGHSAALTHQLLAFARRQAAEPQVIDLNEKVADLLKMMRRLIGENVDLSFHPMDEPARVLIDPSQIDQVLSNLCVNARDAIEGHGKISIELGARDFEEAPEAVPAWSAGPAPGRYIMLAVSDTGAGMTPAVKAQVFEPYFSTKSEGKGTGLGLATVYGIVRQNEGFLNLYSEPGLGTTFRIYLRRHVGVPARAEAPAPVVVRKGSEAIVLVEDEPHILDVARRMLEGLGYVVHGFADPREALAFSRDTSLEFQLLITDVVMPGLNGRALSQAITEERPGVRTIYLSGYTADVIAENGILHPGVRLLHKPFSLAELAERVRSTLDAS